jgi:hypothetical protein
LSARASASSSTLADTGSSSSQAKSKGDAILRNLLAKKRAAEAAAHRGGKSGIASATPSSGPPPLRLPPQAFEKSSREVELTFNLNSFRSEFRGDSEIFARNDQLHFIRGESAGTRSFAKCATDNAAAGLETGVHSRGGHSRHQRKKSHNNRKPNLSPAQEIILRNALIKQLQLFYAAKNKQQKKILLETICEGKYDGVCEHLKVRAREQFTEEFGEVV